MSNIPALGRRLNAMDATCDAYGIYMDSTEILFRATDLSDCDWRAICCFVTGEAPRVEEATFNDPTPLDEAAQARLAIRDHPSNKCWLEAMRQEGERQKYSATSGRTRTDGRPNMQQTKRKR